MNKQDIIDGFASVTERMAQVHEEKLEEYGISRYQEVEHPEAPVMLFSDIHRKYIRLRQQLLINPLSGVSTDWGSVARGCLDLSNYGVMGVQVAELIMSKGRQPPTWERPTEAPAPPPPSPAWFPIEQIAFVGRPEMLTMLKFLGAHEWHHDTVTTRARVFDSGIFEQEALLAFNYQLIPGKELEVIRYTRGENFLSESGTLGGLSHLGLHVDDMDKSTQMLRDQLGEVRIIQEAVTVRHTNPNIKDTRRYRYRIFDTRNTLGFFLKFIQRHIVNLEATGVDWGEPFGIVRYRQ